MRLGSTSLNVTNRSGGGGPLAAATPTPTYALSTDSSVSEGSDLTVTVTTQHVADGTHLYWSISHITTSSSDFSADSGTVIVNSNSATITITADADATTETNPETFGIIVRTGSQSGPIVVQDTSTDLNDTSQTPPPSATYTLSVPANTVLSEGLQRRVTLTTTNLATGTAYWYIGQLTYTCRRFPNLVGYIQYH